MVEVTFARNVKKDKLRNYRGKGNMVIGRYKEAPIIFKGGIFKTSDKAIINKLLSSDELRRGDISLVTPRETVNDWLMGKEPDKLTEETLDKVSVEGLQALARAIGIPVQQHGNYPAVIKSMIRGTAVTNEIYHIIQNNTSEEESVNELSQLMEEGLIYKSGPWYKFKKNDENSTDDLSLGRTDAEAHRWIAENKSLIEKHKNKK